MKNVVENMYNDEVIVTESKENLGIINKLRELNEDGPPRGIYQGNGKYDPPLNQDQLEKDFNLNKSLNSAKSFAPVAGAAGAMKSLGNDTVAGVNNTLNTGDSIEKNGGLINTVAGAGGEAAGNAVNAFKNTVTPSTPDTSKYLQQAKDGLASARDTIGKYADQTKQSIPAAPEGNSLLAAAGVAALGVGAAAAIWNYVMKKKQWLNMGCEQVTDPTQKIKCQIHVMKTTINELSQKRGRCKHANDPKTCMEQTAKQLETLNRQLMGLQNQLQSSAKEVKSNKVQDHDAEPLPF